LFLGSGLFPWNKIRQHQIPMALGSDIGAGTSYSLLKNMSDAYKIVQLQKDESNSLSFSSLHAFYMATLGGATALQLDSFIGNFQSGKEADFIVLNQEGPEEMKLRLKEVSHIEDILFTYQILGDDRCIEASIIMGKEQYRTSSSQFGNS
jgi:guanine deaminase